MSEFNDDEVWPLCTVPNCTTEVHPKRWALGYRTCLPHGERPKQFTVASAYNKGGLQLITHGDIKDIGRDE